ncbi:MAG: energy transducer TonB [Muribaculaceae bacterium]|nr:energy transducer TonB [Muribaculaceae bacterium]
MATQINLSSREWCDLVFEGKNKDFGAYVIRTDSPNRHNKAVLWTLIGTIIFGLITLGFVKANQYIEERRLAEMGEQVVVPIDYSEEAEEPNQDILEEEKPEVLPEEEVLNTIQVTELQIVEDNEVRPEDEIVSQEDIITSSAAVGATNFDQGTNDLNVTNTHPIDVVIVEPRVKPEAKPEPIFQAVEQMPQFPGGDEALLKYLSSHINYPPMAAEDGIQGRVIVQFVVDKTGRVGEVKLVRGVDKNLDNEAVRVCKLLPKFTPGRQNGQPVSVWYTLPVTFKLQGTN